MTTELATHSDTAFDTGKIELLKRTICRGATNDELELFIHACKRTGLDPFMRQIHAVKRKQPGDNGEWKEVMTIQTGIDGYRLIAERTEKYMPGREPSYEYNKETGNLVKATAYVKKLDKSGVWHEIAASAFYDEYASFKKDGSPTKMWAEKPHIMTAKCAESLALRRAFPAELSGVYTSEEMEQADGVATISPKSTSTVVRDVAPDPATKAPVPVVLATPEQVAEIKSLVGHLNDETVEDWFRRAGVETWEEMKTQTIAGCIKSAKSKISKAAASVKQPETSAA